MLVIPLQQERVQLLHAGAEGRADGEGPAVGVLGPDGVERVLVELYVVAVAEYDADVDFAVLGLDGFARPLFERFVGVTAPETAVGVVVAHDVADVVAVGDV